MNIFFKHIIFIIIITLFSCTQREIKEYQITNRANDSIDIFRDTLDKKSYLKEVTGYDYTYIGKRLNEYCFIPDDTFHISKNKYVIYGNKKNVNNYQIITYIIFDNMNSDQGNSWNSVYNMYNTDLGTFYIEFSAKFIVYLKNVYFGNSVKVSEDEIQEIISNIKYLPPVPPPPN